MAESNLLDLGPEMNTLQIFTGAQHHNNSQARNSIYTMCKVHGAYKPVKLQESDLFSTLLISTTQ